MKKINIILFGIGNVGSTLINQIEASKTNFESKGLIIKIPVLTNSKVALFKKEGVTKNWQNNFKTQSSSYHLDDIVDFVKKYELENLIAIDVTSSIDFAYNYKTLIQNGFHIISANKTANTLDYKFYKSLRQVLNENKKQFLYETNVGAGLPIVELIKNLHNSGDEVKHIRGVFSGSLSYIFNTFSESNESFSNVLKEASQLGFTEPDARDDLSGKDVARKLLILARELGVEKELDDITVESLVPKQLNGTTTAEQFYNNLNILDANLGTLKANQKNEHVLRYIGELDVDNQVMKVKLISTNKNTPIGQLKHADNVFEIYSDSYSNQPLVLKGAGAGKVVTARGVLNDVFKLANSM